MLCERFDLGRSGVLVSVMVGRGVFSGSQGDDDGKGGLR